MKQIKKHAIGYNTVSSTDGIISARGVKSYPNNLEIYGYTHEIGDGEKSPDNPYQLVSLDSGSTNVDDVEYEHSIVLSNNDTTIQVPVPIVLNSVEGVSDYIFKDNDRVWKLVQMCKTINSTDFIDSLAFQSTASTGTIVYKLGYQKDLSNNRTNTKTNMFTIVKESVSMDNIAKFFITTDSNWKIYIRYNQIQYAQFSDVDTLRTWLLENPFEIVYKAVTPIEHTLSDYAQYLLNSFTLQNQNRIFVEGNPDIKISGYIQK